jgi:hypothetical protein
MTRVVVLGARSGGKALESTRYRAGRVLDRLQLRMRRFEVRHDPAAQQWANEMRAESTRGTLRERIENQARPEQIVEEWLSSRST